MPQLDTTTFLSNYVLISSIFLFQNFLFMYILVPFIQLRREIVLKQKSRKFLKAPARSQKKKL